MTGEREAWGDALKGVLIVFVVLWHVVTKSYLHVDWQIGLPVPGAWGLLSDMIWSFLMPLFLLVSGCFAANALTRPWSVIIRTRIGRFAYLYLLWSLVHMVAMWAFPDFPTLVPRNAAELVEYLTVSPPNTWYLYALAVYFVVAKALRRVAPWVLVGAAAGLSIVVSAGHLGGAGNRGSLLYNVTFFLFGVHLAPQIRRLVARVTAPAVALLVVVHAAAFGAMKVTGTETLPGVWPLVSLAGVTMGLAAAPMVARIPTVGAGLRWLGQRTLPVYVLHMPLLAIADEALHERLSAGRIAVQLVAAVALPGVLTAVLVAVCLLLEHLLSRDGASWPFDVSRPTMPWRGAAAVVVLAGVGVAATRANAIAGCPSAFPRQPATTPGEVSIASTGDLLIHDVEHDVPADGGASYFDAVEPWFTQDLVTGNLEQAITEDTGYVKCGADPDCLRFRSGPETAQHFAGFDLLSLANNHTGDFGVAGYANTEANLAAAGVRTVGRRNEIACTTIGDITVAVIGFSPYGRHNRITDLRHTKDVVAAAAATADVVVVHAEMGAEGPDANVVRPGPERMFGEDRGDVMAFSRAAIDAGADLVLGHGPHVLRGMELYEGRLIAYSLGNFGGGGVFGEEAATRYGVYLDVRLGPDGELVRGRLRSIHFEFEGGRPLPDPDGRAVRLVDELSRRDFPETAPRIDADGTVFPPIR